jgi:hypothetical protein
MHARVVDGEVVESGPLPISWTWPDGSTTSDLDRLGPEDHARAGWYPVTEERPTPGTGQTWGDPVFTVGAGTVTAVYPLVGVVRTPDPVAALAGIVDALSGITPTSTMSQVRTALIAVHAASSAATPGP